MFKQTAKIRSGIGLGLILLAMILMLIPPPAQADSHYIMVLDADGAIVPAMDNYLERGIKKAESDNAELVIIQLDTPGGTLSAMESIIQHILESDVPVVVYVAPRGATAGSAGAIITLAGHQSAMAPDTVIGAASPINGDGTDLTETVETKAQNVMLAKARTLTEGRSPEARALAEDMITDATTLTAEEALEAGVIDYIATDIQDLITQLDGQTIIVNDNEVTLELTGLEIRNVDMNFVEQALLILTDPVLVFSLLSVGVLLIIIELSAPGGWLAGTLGAISLLLSLYGLGVLPINWVGLVLILASLVMFAIEIQTPGTQGLLSFGAAISLGLGGYIMFNRPEVEPYGELPLFLILIESALFGMAGAGVVFVAVRTKSTKIITGSHGMIGEIGEVRRALEPQGMVFVHGELWKAETQNGAHVEVGQKVEVVELDSLRVKVMPLNRE